jgi:hypothetical protein
MPSWYGKRLASSVIALVGEKYTGHSKQLSGSRLKRWKLSPNSLSYNDSVAEFIRPMATADGRMNSALQRLSRFVDSIAE